MLFTKLKLNYFGRFQNKEIELKPGINLIYGENEDGKSTIHTFIRGMLFGIERLRGRGSATKEDLYTRYLPWDYPGAFGGSMDIQIGEKDYRLQRSFHANDKNFTLFNLSTGREVKLREGLISELIPGLTESAFKNTISIEQLKAQTDAELAAQVRNYIANLSIAKSKEVDVSKAVSKLTEQRKQLEASQNAATTALKELHSEIEEGMAKEDTIDHLTITLRKLLNEEQIMEEQKETVLNCLDNETAKRMEQLPAILEKYHSYQELLKQENSLEEQSKELQTKISIGEKEQPGIDMLKEDIQKVQKLQVELLELEKKELEPNREKDSLNKVGKRSRKVILLPFIIIAIIFIAFTGHQPIGLIIAAILCAAVFIGYLLQSRKIREEQRAMEAKDTAFRMQKDTIHAGINDILHRNRVYHIEELTRKHEEALRYFYALEHAKEQLKDLTLRKTELEDNRDVLYETIMKYMQYFIPEEELTYTGVQKLQEVITKTKQETSSKLGEISRQQEICKLNIEKLKWEIAALEGNEKELLKNKERYCELEQKHKENVAALEAVKLALSSIQELSADIHDSFGQRLNIAVTEVISEITDHKYTDLKVDEKLEVKVGWDGKYVLLDRLSAGTIEQIYFALRMTVADLLLGKDEVPLLLDDSFAFYDEMRVGAALTMLAKRQQVILFTCHKREQILLKERNLSYHLIDLSCN
ncbi:MAG: AAA family ATPase [Herbinix sp.]|nr:AAA family ATPase [Herbinix sp.]